MPVFLVVAWGSNACRSHGQTGSGQDALEFTRPVPRESDAQVERLCGCQTDMHGRTVR